MDESGSQLLVLIEGFAFVPPILILDMGFPPFPEMGDTAIAML